MLLHGHAHRTILSIIIGLVLANTGVALRFIARWVGGLKVTIDDYLMLSALVSHRWPAFSMCEVLTLQLPYWGMTIGGILSQS